HPDESENAVRFAGRIERAVAALADEAATDWWSARQRAARGESPSLSGPDSTSWRRAWALGDRHRPRAARSSPTACTGDRTPAWPRF
ncbi:MAG: hypothetical protein H0V52_00845, partial [Acidimicrobiia bacterium]|nr:hypothetical protein [Acidimicrobiia bacterium]